MQIKIRSTKLLLTANTNTHTEREDRYARMDHYEGRANKLRLRPRFRRLGHRSGGARATSGALVSLFVSKASLSPRRGPPPAAPLARPPYGPMQRNLRQEASTGLVSTRRAREGEGGGRRRHSTQAANTAMARQGGGARGSPARSPSRSAGAAPSRSPRSGSAGAASSAPAPPARARITYAYVRYLFIWNRRIG